DKVMRGDGDGYDGEQKIREGQHHRGSDCTAKNVEIETQASLKKNDDQGNGGEYRTDCAKVLWRDQMKNGSQHDADDGQKENIGNAGSAKESRERMRHEDKESDDQDVGGDMHSRRALLN